MVREIICGTVLLIMTLCGLPVFGGAFILMKIDPKIQTFLPPLSELWITLAMIAITTWTQFFYLVYYDNKALTQKEAKIQIEASASPATIIGSFSYCL